jgi:hypothetical protein
MGRWPWATVAAAAAAAAAAACAHLRLKTPPTELGCGLTIAGQAGGCVTVRAALDWSGVDLPGHSPFKEAVWARRAPRVPAVRRQLMP